MSTSMRNQATPIQNTNRWSTKQLVTMALMGAIAILLSFVEFPIMPAASFLKLDIALVPAAVVGFAYGAGPGVLVGIVYAVAHAAIDGNWVGALMNSIVAIAFITPAAAIYKRNRTFKGAVTGMIISSRSTWSSASSCRPSCRSTSSRPSWSASSPAWCTRASRISSPR